MRSLLIIVPMLLVACGDKPAAMQEMSGSTMGTRFRIKMPGQLAAPERQSLQQQIDSLLGRLEAQMSTYLIDSEISQFNVSRSTEWYGVSEEFCHCVESALSISELTSGAFDITVGPLVNLWGFGPDGVVLEPPSDRQITEIRQRVGYAYLHTDCSQPALRKDIGNLYVDMSAFAKGYAADRIARLLENARHSDFLVEVGGELSLRGENSSGERWSIAIEAPTTNERSVHTIIRLTDTALATSGDYRNYFDFRGKRYSHTIDVTTGYPVSHNLASVTVLDNDAARADALATALLVLGPERGMTLATQLEIAALFLSRGDSGIEEQSTAAFAMIRQE